jgi:hypothetical protein
MNSSQLPQSSAPTSRLPRDEGISRWPADDDYALGWECANPELQIDSWNEQSASRKHELN